MTEQTTTLTYTGTEAIRLPADLVADRADGDDRPAHIVEAGDTVRVDYERAAVLIERDDWDGNLPRRRKTKTADPAAEAAAGDKMTGDEETSSDEADEAEEV